MSKEKQSVSGTKTAARVLLAAVFVLLTAVCVFAGAGAAFEVTTPADIDPSGPLNPDENVTGHMQIKIPAGTIDDDDKIKFKSDLSNVTWTVTIRFEDDNTPLMTKTMSSGDSAYISGFDVGYNKDCILDIEMNGTVSSLSAGQNITVMKIEADEKSGLSSWSTPTQYVNNTALPIRFEGLNISPNGSLTTGDKVVATVNMEIPGGAYDSSSSLNLLSDLDAAEWTIVLQQGGVDGVIFSKTGKSVTLTSYDITYPKSIVLKISISGVVSSESAGQDITVMRVNSFGKDGLTSWSTPTQYVNNTISPIGFGNPKVYPNGSLTTGESVAATVDLEIPGGTYDSASSLNLSSDLDAAEWTIVLQQGGVDGVIFSKTGKSVTLTSYDITYPKSIVLKISISGVVSSESAGQDITVMRINSFGKDGLTSWSTPTQYVYNTTGPQIETVESGPKPSPTITPTVTPLPTPTVALTTEKGQTTEQTKDLPKSPAPILGILAGFGAVALLFTIRQR